MKSQPLRLPIFIMTSSALGVAQAKIVLTFSSTKSLFDRMDTSIASSSCCELTATLFAKCKYWYREFMTDRWMWSLCLCHCWQHWRQSRIPSLTSVWSIRVLRIAQEDRKLKVSQESYCCLSLRTHSCCLGRTRNSLLLFKQWCWSFTTNVLFCSDLVCSKLF